MDGAFQIHRVPHVVFVKGDVVVAHQHQVRVGGQLVLHPAAQGGEPLHLVLKLVASGLLPVGEVGAYHPHSRRVRRAARQRKGAGDHAGHVVLKPGDVLDDTAGRGAREKGHAVVGFLAEPLRLVADGLKRIGGKLVVGKLELLQCQNVHRRTRRLLIGQPVQHLRQAHAQRVHIPGSKFHSQIPG